MLSMMMLEQTKRFNTRHHNSIVVERLVRVRLVRK